MTQDEKAPVRLKVRVTPKSSRESVTSGGDGVLHVRVNAPPAEGQANRAVVAALAKALRIPKSNISIVSGETSRSKTVEIRGISRNEIQERLPPAG
ncbi:MAG: hypothetical protein KatS3mg024_1463 [Armatimonadota bacterium]|nr:MAG: hypothetical protein KatS3mg024_1463 [Armatimonadota bacterium]